MARFHAFLVAALLGAGAGAGHAALPNGTLTFVTPQLEVDGTAPQDVWVRLTLAADSAPLEFSSNPLVGFDAADLPSVGTFFNPDTQELEERQIAQISSVFLNTYFVCNDTFTDGCNGNTSNWSYGFHVASTPGRPSVNFLESFSLAPGQSFDYVFATFTPAPGGAQAGVYRFFQTGLTLNFRATDIDGNELDVPDIALASTCPGGVANDCAFTRTVTPVPEPGSWAMLTLGLALLGGGFLRRRGN